VPPHETALGQSRILLARLEDLQAVVLQIKVEHALPDALRFDLTAGHVFLEVGLRGASCVASMASAGEQAAGGLFVDVEPPRTESRRDGPDAVRTASSAKKKPPTVFSPGDESRRRREGASTLQNAASAP
jgi:hypothetical protein